MKKMAKIAVVLAILTLLIPVIVYADEVDTTENATVDIDTETQEEAEIIKYEFGASIRLLQL
jgi:Na+-transporting methylmalonyl-CoA/oxaloacetate decarboxylase gamma subunit